MLELTDNLITLSMPQLRRKWQELWNLEAHRFISRPMLEKSIRFKQAELAGHGLTTDESTRLAGLIADYKRDSPSAHQRDLKSGIRLVKTYRDKRYVVDVKDDGLFAYDGKHYSSLSQIAFTITGTNWNGWVFFGLKAKANT